MSNWGRNKAWRGAFALCFLVLHLLSCDKQADPSPPQSPTGQVPPPPDTIALPELASIFDSADVRGSFIWYDLQRDRYYVYNQADIHTRYSPASTFKLPNALIALETGAIRDTNVVIPWDGEVRSWDRWNQDQNLGTAIRYSALWAFRDIARRVHDQDSTTYRTWLDRLAYGNATIGDQIDLFWLDNSLKIAPVEQIQFISALYREALPFQAAHQVAVKQRRKGHNTPHYAFHAKTGWAIVGDRNFGWYLGFVETGQQAYAFCTQVENRSPLGEGFSFRRTYTAITDRIVDEILAKKYPQIDL